MSQFVDDKWRRLKEAAVAVLSVYDGGGERGDLTESINDMRAAVIGLAPPPVRPTPVWDIDPEKHFCRMGGKLVAEVEQTGPTSWVVRSGDGDTQTFVTAESARKYVERRLNQADAHDNRTSTVVPNEQGSWLRLKHKSVLSVNGHTVGLAIETARGWDIFRLVEQFTRRINDLPLVSREEAEHALWREFLNVPYQPEYHHHNRTGTVVSEGF